GAQPGRAQSRAAVDGVVVDRVVASPDAQPQGSAFGAAASEDSDEVAGTPRARRRRRGSRGGRGRRTPGGALGAVPADEDTDDLLDEGDDDDATAEGAVPAAQTIAGVGGTGVAGLAGPRAPGRADGAARSRGGDSRGGERPAKAAGVAPGAGVVPGSGVPGQPDQVGEEAQADDEAGSANGPLAGRPKIGDTRPGSPPAPRRRGGRGAGASAAGAPATGGLEVTDGPGSAGEAPGFEDANADSSARSRRNRRRRSGGPSGGPAHGTLMPVQGGLPLPPLEGAGAAGKAGGTGRAGNSERVGPVTRSALDDLDTRGSGRRGDKKAKPVGRYLMVVHVGPTATQIAVLEGRTLIEHYVSRPADDTTQIDGNIYLGRVQNVLPGMEAAFVDIGTPKNAVLYRGDLRYDDDEVGPAADDASKPTRGKLGGAARDARIEQLLRTGQNIICQVTKNPIGTKGARLTQEVSLPGRFVVLIPDSDTYGISKRLSDEERKRLRKILDDVRPAGHGLIVRTAAEGASADELTRDVNRLLRQWEQVQQLARSSRAPQLLYREPDLAVRVIREEFNRDYRGVVIDDPRLYEQVREYVESITPELADRVELVDPSTEALPLFERFRVHEQVHKALDRKVWLPSGGSLIIERTEALTVIDVNTGKNVGTSNLEETVYRNNLEAAEEIARQLRLRDIGGIIVIDFIDMEVAANRQEVIKTFREALARDKTRSQVFDISELGLVEMTRKRISEGLVESYSETCPTCAGRGIVFDESLL
ncbi:MAG TPA: Rne/Rng family ribonuclease, partial [Acidimicrobiales bacterium]|nr:Rne/Rng family ribonuclease [Acidimicrobiales bacterium]